MSDNEPSTSPLFVDVGYPNSEFVTVYADGLGSCAHSTHNIKMYFFRVESNLLALEPSKAFGAAQVVMPIDGFIQATAFMDNMIEWMIHKGTLTREVVNQIKATAGKPNVS